MHGVTVIFLIKTSLSLGDCACKTLFFDCLCRNSSMMCQNSQKLPPHGWACLQNTMFHVTSICMQGLFILRVHYTPPPIPVGFWFVRLELPESQESGGLFFCMYCPFMEIIQQDSFIKFTPGIPGFPPDKFTARLTGINHNNWTNRTARGLPNKSLAPNKNRTRALRYKIPTQHITLNH